MKAQLTEALLVNRISSQEQLVQYLKDHQSGQLAIAKIDAEKCLRENFMIPLNLRKEMLEDTQVEDVSEKLAERMFTMVDETKFTIPSDT